MMDEVKGSELPDSGARIDYGTGAKREPATGKGRFDLLPAYALKRVAMHFENGARKYQERNWEKGIPCSRFVDSALRHIFAWLEGGKEEDHLAAGVWNLMCLIETEHRASAGKLPRALCDMPGQLQWVARADLVDRDVTDSEERFGNEFLRRVLEVLENRGAKIGGYFRAVERQVAVVRFFEVRPNEPERMAEEIERVIVQEGGVVALQDAVIGDAKLQVDRGHDGAIVVACGYALGRRSTPMTVQFGEAEGRGVG